jgi:Glycosyl hydrolase family 12
MRNWNLHRLALFFITITVIVALALPAFAGSSSGGSPNWNQNVCGHLYVPVNMGHGDYFNVYNAPDGSTCVTVEKNHLDWYISRQNGTKLWGYPNISSGIEWGKYTCYDGKSAHPGHGSECMRYPVQEKNDGAPVASLGRVWPHLRKGNVSFDIWFNKTYVSPNRLRQDDGTEIMIWLQHPGLPLRNILWTTRISGHEYDVIGWTAFHNNTHWNYLAYVSVHKMSSFPKTRLNLFFRNAISHGRLSPGWWLTSIDFGTEIASGGLGFDVHDYSLTGVK